MSKNVPLALSAATTIVVALVLSGTAGATYPGSNDGRLAFAMNVGGNVDIYSVLPNGEDLRRLTDESSFDACPSYSADGKEIAFCSGKLGGTEEIWTMKQNGTQKVQITRLGGQAIFPDFSPMARRFSFPPASPATRTATSTRSTPTGPDSPNSRAVVETTVMPSGHRAEPKLLSSATAVVSRKCGWRTQTEAAPRR